MLLRTSKALLTLSDGDYCLGYEPLICSAWGRILLNLSGSADLPDKIVVTIANFGFGDCHTLNLAAPPDDHGWHTSIDGNPVIDSYSSFLSEHIQNAGFNPNNLIYFTIEPVNEQ